MEKENYLGDFEAARMVDERCPLCGATLLFKDGSVWCSMVGCKFGLCDEHKEAATKIAAKLT